ncbi:MAG: hypothetical protein JXB23_06115 [Candidatus Aminicenantes bacterium]|nr:hypothetical protein [Candidatus Aminicenantes bacterium]
MEITIDEKQVRANAFVQKIMTNITGSIIASLDGIPENPQTVIITLTQGSPLEMTVDGQNVRMNPFVEKTIRNILAGMIRSLDEIPESPKSITLRVATK